MSTYDKASLVLIPSGTKTSKIYSQKPINGDGDFSFSRSTSATRVNQSGFIEKETQNLLLHSSNQLNSVYNIQRGLHNQTAVYNPLTGNNDAFKLGKISGEPDPYKGQTIYTSVNGCYTGSIYLWTDSGQPTDCQIFFYNIYVSEVYSKSITLTTTPTRYEFFVNFNNTGGEIRFRLDLSSSTDAYLYTYGWQLERGLAARDYIETTTSAVYGGITDNVPRIDYTDASCPSLLLEPTRTNLVLSSEYPHNSGIDGIPFARGGANITYNYGISPEGLQNSTLVSGTSGNVGIQVSFSNSDINVDWSYSFYIKGNSGETVHLRYELTPYVLNSQEYITFTGDWQRIEKTISYDGTAHTVKQWYVTFLQQSTATQFEIYGLQAESNAAYPTSYIPTYGTSVTRNIESLSKYDFENSTSQTLFIECGQTKYAGGGGEFIFEKTNPVAAIFRIYIEIDNSGTNVSRIRLRTEYPVNNYDFNLGNKDEFKKIALSINGNTIKLFGNGSLLGTYQVTVVELEQFNWRVQNSTYSTKQLIMFPTVLTDEELEDLTTI